VPAAPPVFETQFFEQQSPTPTVQESPSVLQPLPPGRAAHALVVVPATTGSHSPVQHSGAVEQDAPCCLQEPAWQVFVPGSHASEQHSPDEPQGLPTALQNAAVAQVAEPAGPLHISEQQSEAALQAAPLPPQVPAGDAQTPLPLDVSQRPEQQSFAAAQLAAIGWQTLTGSVQTPFAHAFVQQDALVRQAPPAALQVAVLTQALPAQPSPSPAQQSAGMEQDCERCEHAGTWQVRAPDAGGQARPMQQSASARQGALAAPQVGAGVQVPLTHESDALQHGTVGEQAPFVAPHVAGGTQVVVPELVGSMQESPPLQHGTVPEQAPFVPAQLAGAVQTLPVQESAPLQHATPGGAQAAPVPAQTAGAVQTLGVPEHVSAGLQQSELEVQVAPVPAQLAALVQTLLPAGPAQAPARALQQSESPAQLEPVPAQAAGAAQRFPAQTSLAVQHGREAHEEPRAAQVAVGGGLSGSLFGGAQAALRSAARTAAASGKRTVRTMA
jgi:hypothetical protein